MNCPHPLDVFFPGKGHSYQEAEALCATCPQRLRCLLRAIDDEADIPRDDLHGYRALSPRQRYEIRVLLKGRLRAATR